VWAALAREATEELRQQQYAALPPRQALETLQGRRLGVARLRLLPKRSGGTQRGPGRCVRALLCQHASLPHALLPAVPLPACWVSWPPRYRLPHCVPRLLAVTLAGIRFIINLGRRSVVRFRGAGAPQQPGGGGGGGKRRRGGGTVTLKFEAVNRLLQDVYQVCASWRQLAPALPAWQLADGASAPAGALAAAQAGLDATWQPACCVDTLRQRAVACCRGGSSSCPCEPQPWLLATSRDLACAGAAV
jgi:hypothetical protein